MLSDADRATYEWQLDVPGLGERGQEKLGSATALVSRVGGLGGPLAMSLAAAGSAKSFLFMREICRKRTLTGKHLCPGNGLENRAWSVLQKRSLGLSLRLKWCP